AVTAQALAACGGGGREGGGAASKPPRSVPVAIWARGTSDKGVFDRIAGVVETQAPHLAVSTEVAEGINDKLVVALAGGGAPDLAVVNMPFGVPMVGRGAFLSLYPYLGNDRATDQEQNGFLPPALPVHRYKDEHYGITILNDTNVP